MQVYLLLENNGGNTEVLGVFNEIGKAFDKFEKIDIWTNDNVKTFKENGYLEIDDYSVFITTENVQ